MPPGFSSEFKELVRSRTDLVELVGESVQLTPLRGGADHVGLCPFHDDHSPSFHVYPDRQSYRCWVCDEGGDCFSFLMKLENVEFPEALRMLAERAHLEIPKSQGGRSGGQEPSKPQLYDVLTWAENEFHRCLLESPAGERARDYLRQRGFTAEIIARFRVGYHPDDWQWLLNRARNKFSPAQLIDARVCGQNKGTDRPFDYFVDRVMFPIRDGRARCVAFGGRQLPDRPQPNTGKYLNSHDSPLFAKSKLLYGLDVARDTIRRSEVAVVMEGYTDCMMAHQYGVENVVATLGTALTEIHVLNLKRLARRVVLVYDGDEAGQRAAERSISKFLAQEVDLRILTLPGGLDPADFLAEQGGDAFQEQIEQAGEAWEYKLAHCIQQYGTNYGGLYKLDSIDARQRVLDDMLDLLSQVPRLSGSIRQDMILGKLSQRLQLDEQAVRKRLGEIRRKQARRVSGGASNTIRVDGAEEADSSPKENTKHHLLERELLEIIFAAPDIVETIRQQVEPSEYLHPPLRELLKLCYQLSERGILPSYEQVTVELEDIELKQLAVEISDSSRAKNIAGKLQEAGQNRRNEPPDESFVAEVIRHLKWRQEEASHELSKGQMGERSATSTGLDANDKELLRMISEFHQKRATKKTLT